MTLTPALVNDQMRRKAGDREKHEIEETLEFMLENTREDITAEIQCK